jgi:hypothetical protein
MPFVFLAWGIISFFIAIVLYSVFAVGVKSSEPQMKLITTVLVAIFGGVVVFLSAGVHLTISHHSTNNFSP